MQTRELSGSGNFSTGADGTSGELHHIAVQAESYDQVYAQALILCPDPFNNVPRVNLSVKEDPGGAGVYYIDADYRSGARTKADSQTGTSPSGGKEPAGNKDPNSPLGREWTWSTGGGTVNVKTSIKTVSKTAAPGEQAVDFKGLINVTREGVAGVDIIAPKAQFGLSLRLQQVTLKYFLNLLDMTGKTNDAPWKGIAAREALFLGSDGHYQDSQSNQQEPPWTVNFQWAFERTWNATDIAAFATQTGITIPEKAGHDYLWVSYKETTQTVGGQTFQVQVPAQANVEQVYLEDDFGRLKLGS